MVITTKQPRQSMPAAPSRTASSTATAKTAKRASLNVKPATSIPPRPLQDTLPDIDIPPAVRAPPSNITLGSKFDATGPFADDAKFNPSPKKMTKRVVKRPLPKRPSKAYKKKKARHWSELIELLTKTTVLLLCIYSVLVCPKDAQLQSPVCRGLDHYRRTIVDRYILPPLRAFVAHPAVAPQIERARPYVEQAVETVKTQYHIANDKVAVAASPYILMARQQYAVRFRPHVKLMEYNLRRYHKRVQPYINLARRTAIQKWIQAQPYIDPVLVKLQQAPVLVKTFIQQPLEHGKERWVDPQVKKIMDKVHEMGVAATTVGQEGPDSIKQKPIVPEPVPEEMFATPQHFVDQTPTTYYSSPAPESTSTQSTPSESTTTATMELIDEPTPTEDPRDKPLYNPNYHDDVEDIEFWEQFEEWLSESILTTDPPATSTTSSLRPAPTKLTDEEKAERDRKEKEETAIKRKEIVGRHEKWEKELEALIESETNALVKTISNIRKKMSEELSVKETIQEQLKKMRDELSEGKKYAKVPLDRYKEDWEDRYGSFDENIGDKIPQWLNILESLDRNFERRVESVNKDLAEWVPMWVKQESEAIKNAGDKITSFADKAQADLIGDYAWLWDVTHRDWDRYHQLMFRGRDAKQKLQDLANGAIESALTNPVKTQLAKMKEEMTKLHHEYFTEINKIRQQGWKYLLGDAWSEEAAQKYMDRNDASKFGTEPDKIGVPKPKSPLDREVSLEDLASNPIIGKDKEQVVQAMEAMEAERAKHEEL